MTNQSDLNSSLVDVGVQLAHDTMLVVGLIVAAVVGAVVAGASMLMSSFGFLNSKPVPEVEVNKDFEAHNDGDVTTSSVAKVG